MKKIIVIIGILAICSLIFCSCKENSGKSDETSGTQTTVTDANADHETEVREESDTEPDSDSGDRLNDRYWSQNYIPKK